MLLSIALIVVVVLLAVALLPIKKREPDVARQSLPTTLLPSLPLPPLRQSSLRQQQLDEESAAVANEYQRRADAEWLEEIRTKASKLLSDSKATRES